MTIKIILVLSIATILIASSIPLNNAEAMTDCTFYCCGNYDES